MSITSKINTVEEALEALGEPDSDTNSGFGVTEPEVLGKPRKTVFYRTLRYHQLSKQAVVEFLVYPEDGIKMTLIPKPIEAEKKC